MDNLVIDTPEQIPLNFPLAGVGSRFLALAIDTLFQVAGFLLLGGVGYAIQLKTLKQPNHGAWMLALFVLGSFLLTSGYFTAFEALWNGQTPGKRLTHLRVIQDSGRPITVYDAMARNLMRIVDSLPGLYGVGIISALLSSNNKRLGDYVAGTVVVREKPSMLEAAPEWNLDAPPDAVRYDVSRMKPEEFQLIETFLLRRSQLAPGVRAQTGKTIAYRLVSRLGLTPIDFRNSELFLESLANAYRAQARFK